MTKFENLSNSENGGPTVGRHSGAAGAVAAGDTRTAQAAAEMLADGGNAFDAALAGLFVACIAEPVLCSLGGGGFLLAQSSVGANARGAVLYDFFCQTPGRRLPASELDFQPAPVNFGAASQDFQIGMGAVAVPGMQAGDFSPLELHQPRKIASALA